jgi:hypothetical protein
MHSHPHVCLVSFNPRSGPIPPSISNAKELRHLNLGGNKLEGHVPLLPRSIRLFNVRYYLGGSLVSKLVNKAATLCHLNIAVCQ